MVPPRPRARRRRTVAALVVVGLGLGLASWRLFVAPAVDHPRHADAIVVLHGPGETARVRAGFALAREGVADLVVFSDPNDSASDPIIGYCFGQVPPVPVLVECFDPEPATTRGEARAIAELADDHGWESVAVVAGTDQVTRARMLVERCYDGEVAVVGAPSGEPIALRVAYEWGAMIKALTVARGC